MRWSLGDLEENIMLISKFEEVVVKIEVEGSVS